MPAAYLEAYKDGRLEKRLRRCLSWMTKCTMCPRFCRVNRLKGEVGTCRTGRLAVVASYGAHFGEEAPLVGEKGSGTIFFSHCNLYCLFCQNYDISHEGQGVPVTAGQLCDMMLYLQQRGCHNINLVTPSHVISHVLEALDKAIPKGLHVPLVYNCGGYERVETLRLLNGIVDIYMPDFKFWDQRAAEEFCAASDYPARAREALREMHSQVGDLQVDEYGVATRGLLVRHLVMPGDLAGSRSILHFISNEISVSTYVNIMDQYHPCGKAIGRSDIGRQITSEEYRDALNAAREVGLERLDDRRRRLFISGL